MTSATEQPTVKSAQETAPAWTGRDGPDVRYALRWFLLSVAIGVGTGLIAALFFKALEFSVMLFSHRLAGFYPPLPGGDPSMPEPVPLPIPRWIALLTVPALGGLIAGILLYVRKPEAERGGTDSVIDSFHQRRGRLGLAAPAMKAVASVVVIGSGGSVGREGPMVSLGAGLGSKVAQFFNLKAAERRIALLVGAAAGFASIFRAPLSGAIFAIESPYRNPEFEYPAFMPAIIGSLASWATFNACQGVYGFHPVFTVGSIATPAPLELIVYAVFGLVCAGAGIFYTTVLHAMRERGFDRLFRRMHFPNYLKPALGGLLLGALVLVRPEVWGTGYGWVQLALDGALGDDTWAGIAVLFVLAAAKVVATAITYGSRGGEGVFGPTFFFGAMVGGGYGHLCHALFPDVVVQPAAYVLVGMSGVFAGITKVPIAGLVMVCEITGSYSLLLPLVLVCSISYVFTGKASVYKSQVASRYDSPAHLGAVAFDVLKPATVKDALGAGSGFATLKPDQPIADVLALLPTTKQSTFPVVDGQNCLLGTVGLEDLRDLLFDVELHRLILVSELASDEVPTVEPGEPVLSALRKLASEGCEEIPVVEGERRNLLGLLSREQILRLYRARLDAIAHGAESDGTAMPHR